MRVERILIRGPNWVGDAVLAIPAIKAIRSHFPDAELTLLVRPWVSGLFTTAPFIDHVWSEPKPKGVGDWSRIARGIRERHFDLAILLPNSFESALMTFLGRVPVRLGYATDARRLLLTNAITPGKTIRHQIHYYLDLVRTISVAVDKPSIEIRATPQEIREARSLLAAEGIDPSERFLVLNPGAAYGSAKRWSEDRFAEAGERLAAQLGVRVVLVGSASEKEAAIRIKDRMKTPVVILTGKTTLEVLIGVLAESALMLTNDSGPMHIAAALGVPTVAVFGSTDERVTGPYGKRARIVKHAVDCSPCCVSARSTIAA